MTYLRPIESTEEDATDVSRGHRKGGGRWSRRKPWREGLAAQTVIENLEDIKSYRAFERTICAGFDPRSVIEFELIHRLASLLWRLRRAIAIEAGLFQIQSELQHDYLEGVLSGSGRLATEPTPLQADGSEEIAPGPDGWRDPGSKRMGFLSLRQALRKASGSRIMARSFLRLSNLDPSLLERAGAYEARLWRQVAQTIWTLDAMRRPPPAATRRPFRKPAAYQFWDQNR
jgi:hypothetical protein